MLKQATKRLNKVNGVILHSDQGWQYQMAAYRRLLSPLSNRLTFWGRSVFTALFRFLIHSTPPKSNIPGSRCLGSCHANVEAPPPFFVVPEFAR